MMTGILALQGAFAEHAACLARLGEPCRLIRKPEELHGVDRLILPGGESTAQRKLLETTGLFSPIRELLREGMPVMGTCAGLILLAQEVAGEPPCFGILPVEVQRNAYGRQLGSFFVQGQVGELTDVPMRFIRAPYVARVLSEEVEVLNVTEGRITAVRWRNCLGLAFHPELTEDLRLYQYF